MDGQRGRWGTRRAGRWLTACLLAAACASGIAQPAGESQQLTDEERAAAQWHAGYVLHTLGDYKGAIDAFRASIGIRPTAEAYTYLGWSLSHLGDLEKAIEQCKQAIRLDPEFGNPYNDIGVYLIDLDRAEEAVPWLKKAISAKRYCCYQFPHFNLGRVRLKQGRIEEAKRSFEKALQHDPRYFPALAALEYIRRQGLKGM